MLIQYCSDLHLEFPDNKALLKAAPLQPVGEILVLAGDIVPFYAMGQHKDFFSYVADHFAYTYWLPGNHEYYHGDIATRSGVVNEQIKSNVLLVNNTAVQHNGVRLLFSTLWSHISPAYEWQIENNMSDFSLIRRGRYRFTAEACRHLHSEALAFLQQQLALPFTGTTIVATHHVPTLMHYPEMYKGSLLNEAFATELYPMIESSLADYWIYGHHHSNTPPFTIGRTTLLTNQLGYVAYGENRLFDNAKTIAV